MIRANQKYRTVTPGRARYIIILQVRSAGGYAIVREVKATGEPIYGRDGNGLKRSENFRVGISAGVIPGYVPCE